MIVRTGVGQVDTAMLDKTVAAAQSNFKIAALFAAGIVALVLILGGKRR